MRVSHATAAACLAFALGCAGAGGDDAASTPASAEAATDGAASPGVEIPEEVVDEPPAPTPGFMVILYTDRDEAAGKQHLAEVQADWPSARLYDSNLVEGLKPDWWVTSVALLGDEATAKKVELNFEGVYGQSYVRSVTHTDVETLDCAAEPADKRCSPQSGLGIIVFDYTDGMSDPVWEQTQSKVLERGKAAGIIARYDQADGELKDRIEFRGETVATVDIEALMQDDHRFGYVFVKPGAEPQFQESADLDTVMAAAAEYFGAEIP